eukprot:TRINITY_DN76317_c0_g1_i1.p1 TRINITY_DN76317_c0_g1~~TRINITY_DN76317_c0_g1_i1.p1  ORF type:complete len:482 (+),score=66.85 TRINITY_DN76317_c0_g1_i1:43-1446(+)
MNAAFLAFVCVLSAAQASDSSLWARQSSMMHARYGMAVGATDANVFLIGGSSSPHLSAMAAGGVVERYTPAHNSWTEVEAMPTPRFHTTFQVYNNKIYVLGGAAQATNEVSAVLEVYDTEANTWTTATPMQVPRSSLGSAIVDGKLYAMGGFDSQGLPLATVEVYNLESGSWSMIGNVMPARAAFGSLAHNGNIFLFGGIGELETSPSQKTENVQLFTSSDVLQWNPSIEGAKWTKAATMPVGTAYASLVGLPKVAYVVGGKLADNELSERIDAFNLDNMQWHAVGTLPKASADSSVVYQNGKLFSFGGYAAKGTPAAGSLLQIQPRADTYSMSLGSAAAKDSSWSWFGIITGVAFVAVVGYFAVGAAYRHRQGYRGGDAVPNQEFWTNTLPTATGTACGRAVEALGQVGRGAGGFVGGVGRKLQNFNNADSSEETQELDDPTPTFRLPGKAKTDAGAKWSDTYGGF